MQMAKELLKIVHPLNPQLGFAEDELLPIAVDEVGSPELGQPQQLLVGHSVNFRIGDSGLSVLFHRNFSCQIGLWRSPRGWAS